MTTSRTFSAAALGAALMLSAVPARAGHHNLSVTTRGHGDPQSCDDLQIDIGGKVAERAVERQVIPAGASPALKIEVGEGSGIYVRGADRSDFEVVLCKGAPTRRDLDAISVTLAGGALKVRGPESGDWVGYLLIAAPRSAALDVDAENGPISLQGLTGRIAARSENGPISIRDSAGDIDARAQNGPISAHGDGGKLRLSTQNGPIAVGLTGAGWKGEGLEAQAVNGPVALAVPAGYSSGTRVASLGHSPFHCGGGACSQMRRTWDDDGRQVEFGDGPVVVSLSTRNGPVSIQTGGTSDEGVDDDDE
jgi:hypothetical protein